MQLLARAVIPNQVRAASYLQEQGKQLNSKVLSVIAHAGAEGDDEKAAAAFDRGKAALSLPNVRLSSRQHAKPQQLDEVIDNLGQLSPFGKRNLIGACAEVAAHDGHLDPDEVDLVRALGELWDCPVPLTVDA